MSKPYRYVISGVLLQCTPMTTGGNQPDATATEELDNPLARDGKNRLTLRGGSLAGAMIAAGRQLYSDHRFPHTISHGSPQHQYDNPNRLEESRWLFHHAHPLGGDVRPGRRDNIAVRHTTGAARHGAKFDFEVIPAGTRWPFLVEVDVWREVATAQEEPTESGLPPAAEQLVAIALNTLSAWRQGACWLGARVAQGQGWFRLLDDSFRVIRLQAEEALSWPDSNEEPWTGHGQLNLPDGVGIELDAAAIAALQASFLPDHQPYHFGQLELSLEPEEEQESWGVDAISSTRKHASRDSEKAKEILKREQSGRPADWYMPLGQKPDDYLGSKADSLLITDHNGLPILQGAGIRGSLRHVLSWLQRRRGVPTLEPGQVPPPGYDQNRDIVLKLFGETDTPGVLLIRDAQISNDDWKLLCQEMHAEDEFTQGVYAKAKFDRLQLLNARFTAEYCLILPCHISADDTQQMLKTLVEDVNALGAQRLIPIGGGNWKGLGWPRLSITRPELRCAGPHNAFAASLSEMEKG